MSKYYLEDQDLNVKLKGSKRLANAYVYMTTFKSFVNGQEYMDIEIFQNECSVSNDKNEAMAELKDKVENVIDNYNRGNSKIDSKLLSMLRGNNGFNAF